MEETGELAYSGEKEEHMRDILIIGSGPAGLSASLYAKRASLDVLVAEKEYLGTGQIAKSAQVDNYIGLVGKSGYDLGEKFREDAESLAVEFYEGEAVEIKKKDGRFFTKFDNGEEIESKTVIYAAGASYRKLHISGEEKLIGKGVSFCALCEGAFCQDKTAAVIGGGDTALDDAIYLSNIAKKVYLIHRRNEFRGAKRNVLRVENTENIQMVLNAKPVEILGEEQVEAVVLDNGQRLNVDSVFIAIGMEPQSGLLRNLADIDEYGYVAADETGKTKTPGLFVAGDIRTKKLRQVVTAVSDGANAAMSAAGYMEDTFYGTQA